MQRLSLWLAVPVACVFACGDATQPAPPPAVPVTPPAFATVPAGAAAYTPCAETQGNYITDPHFDPNYYPATTFVDTGYPSLANQCGDLVFQNRVRWFTTIYATNASLPSENPWKYWWRRVRYANDGSGELTEVRKLSRSGGTPDTAVVEMPLNEQYDAIGVVLITDSSGTRQISDQPFTSTTPGPWGDVNLKLQHWAEITPPTLTSATHEDGYITLRWSNTNNGRLIDSTNIYRNGQQLRTVGPDEGVETHASPGPGTWKYTLKHVSWPAALAPLQTLGFPNSDTSNAISLTLGTACARRVEDTSYTYTLQYADQYLSAGCSELGTNKRFRWYKAGDVPLTSWSGDTLFDFLGHANTGTQIVILKDWNTTTGDSTKRDTLSFTVSSGQIVLSGPTFITDKQQKKYVATLGGQRYAGQWFERYDDGPQWYAATAYEQDSLLRIWPWGEYTVDLREHKYTGVLRRGRLFIEVCSPDCNDPAPPAALSPTEDAGGWGLFGAGPWIGWGSPDLGRTLRLYDLWGMHDRQSPFTDVGWFTGLGGTLADPETGWEVAWTPRELGLSDVRALDLTLTNTRSRSYVFSMAVDPDLGTRGGDDVASYDPQRDLVLVADGDGSLGLMLRRGSGNALAAVEEYGVGRWAPTISADAWAAQRSAGVHLRGIPGDVQLVLSTAETSGTTTWTIVVIRGTSAEAVRERADVVRRALR